jgi:hypothetical protein
MTLSLKEKNHVILYDTLGLNADCLTQTDPDIWQSHDDYQEAKNIVTSLAAVSDRAERAVKLMQDFNGSVITNEELKQICYR